MVERNLQNFLRATTTRRIWSIRDPKISTANRERLKWFRDALQTRWSKPTACFETSFSLILLADFCPLSGM